MECQPLALPGKNGKDSYFCTGWNTSAPQSPLAQSTQQPLADPTTRWNPMPGVYTNLGDHDNRHLQDRSSMRAGVQPFQEMRFADFFKACHYLVARKTGTGDNKGKSKI